MKLFEWLWVLAIVGMILVALYFLLGGVPW